MDSLFAIGDIHGEYTLFNELLKKWNPDNQELVLLGDLIDRGKDSFKVIQLAKELHEKYGAVILKGNHEELFLNWLEFPYSEMRLFYPQGGRETIHSFFDKQITFSHTPEKIADMLNEQFPEELAFIRNLPYYYEWNDYVFVHGGVDLSLSNWKDTKESDFCWIRNEFHYGTNETGKTFVFGHTPTRFLNPDKSDNVWVSSDKTKFGLDGGAVFGGLLHGLVIEENNKHLISIDKELNVIETSFQAIRL